MAILSKKANAAETTNTPVKWLVIMEQPTSSSVARFGTEAAARAFYENLQNYKKCSRTLAKLIEYEETSNG